MTARAPLRSSGYALVARVLRATGRILGVVVLARWFDVSDVADFALAFAVASIVGLATDLGLTDHTVRVIAGASEDTRAFERRIVMIRLATVVVALPVAWGIGRALGVGDLAGLGASAYVLAGSVTETYASIRRGHRRHDLEAAECVPLLLAVLAASGLAAAGASLVVFYVALGGGALAIAIARGAVLVTGTRGESDAKLRALVVDSRWMLARSVATLALAELPVILLDRLAGDREVALYALAARPIGVMLQLLAVLPMVYLPLLSRAAQSSTERLRARTHELNLLHIVATPAAFAACVVGGELLLRASGERFADGRAVLVVLSLGTLLYASTLSTLPLIVLRRERVVVLASLVGLAALVVASLVLVPERGALGIALATCAAYAAVKIVLIVGYRVLAIPLGDRRQLVALVIVGAALAAGALAPRPIGEAVMIATGAIAGLATLQLLRAAPAD